ncbi:glutamate-ammonia-ligase adenylyltransferase [Marinomonas sp. MED121]|uniref:bifunctional [glutamate--ammonia ligase]-adenylyl-L-tyrosine phosphorylase/[glutamate--ammonia-ligase] adenylyltransferase n=1 Tax=Marinomonas sp. MED121 TaxID=314277 RepID=UPI0000690462|nr:bifunctional [glutamate--ammonia ligase]-adenylyl-L-tyrosine phosphorylase/[glutamate--ammonia-ligase] adenylyltransferase [Marinomonas sp. MED121]EAQ66554.1 glutamate-ammonia-ligase adenylyltransferase [Marinomonas sp. MED121]
MPSLLPQNNPSLNSFYQTLTLPSQESRLAQLIELRPELSSFPQKEALEAVLSLSDYVFQQAGRFPEWVDGWANLDAESLLQVSPKQEPPILDDTLYTLDEKSLMSQLRLFRHQWMCRLIYLDLLQQIDLKDLTKILSELADVCVQTSLRWLKNHYQNLYGDALDSEGELVSMIVIGMGKLGGGELNLSSDIDLIFAFREHGETQNGKKSISHQEYFTKIGQKLIQHLDQITLDGFVFRVDMRLRPYGQSGALVLNLDSLENYYQDQGRDWERYAMIKSRVMAGDEADALAFEQLRRPFVYRKYLDFSAITALRDLKKMIAKEVQRKGIEHNIKLGQGGIREIEFIVQALQILHGGRDTGLQTQSLYQVLPYLAKQGYLESEQVDVLWSAYQLLRRTEHALQAVKDEQTQLLPEDAEQRLRIAIMLGYTEWAALHQALSLARTKVHEAFVDLIEDDNQDASETSDRDAWRLLFRSGLSQTLAPLKNTEFKTDKTSSSAASQPLNQEHVVDLIAEVDWDDQTKVVAQISRFLTSKAVAFMQPIGQERLATFFADFTYALKDEAHPDVILERVFPILEAILRRTSYLVLLIENPTAISHLIRLSRDSAWFSESISNSPMLLDELLDGNTLFSPPDKAMMEDELRQILLRLPEDDEEAHMDALRRFRRSIILRIAACDITEVLPLMKVSDHLTWLAEVIVEQVLQKAWYYLIHRHGYPTYKNDQAKVEAVLSPELVVVGYGKSGGLELGYDSDLDLVFIHNSDRSAYTNGDRSIDNLTFYTRLGQRIIHMLTSFTSCGRLYEVDMRLRPSGNSGLLVTSLEAFNDYQNKEAWIWEHQALTRARVVSGNQALALKFEQSRQQILAKERDQSVLKGEVIKMREKMRKHLDTGKTNTSFDLKQGAGGIIDIEFMVQFMVLAWSHRYPELMRYSDNIRQIEASVAAGILTADDANVMTEAYKLYRAQTHRLTLQKQTRVIPKEQLQANQEEVNNLWQAFVLKES